MAGKQGARDPDALPAIEEQGDLRGQPDVHAADIDLPPDPNAPPAVGGVKDKPDALDRGDRSERKGLKVNEEREAMYERMRQKRKDRGEGGYDEEEPSGEGDAAPADGDEATPPAARAADAPPAPGDKEGGPDLSSDAPPEKRYHVRVDHKDLFLTEAEMIQQAQIGLASGNRVSELNEALAEVRRMREHPARQPDSSAHQPADGDDADLDDPARTKGKTDFRELAEQIQTGDAEDGAKVLERLSTDILERVRAEHPHESEEDVAARVKQELQAEAADRSFRQYFTQHHPELVGDDVMQFALMKRMHPEVIEELRAAVNTVTKQPLTEEQIALVIADPHRAVEWLNKYAQEGVKRKDGKPLANPLQVMDRAADFVKKHYRLAPPAPKPAPTDPNRQQTVRQEKRQLSEPRPAQAGRRQDGEPPRLTPEERRKRAVEQRKQATGFGHIA